MYFGFDSANYSLVLMDLIHQPHWSLLLSSTKPKLGENDCILFWGGLPSKPSLFVGVYIEVAGLCLKLTLNHLPTLCVCVHVCLCWGRRIQEHG